jgi:hypothetical protein
VAWRQQWPAARRRRGTEASVGFGLVGRAGVSRPGGPAVDAADELTCARMVLLGEDAPLVAQRWADGGCRARRRARWMTALGGGPNPACARRRLGCSSRGRDKARSNLHRAAVGRVPVLHGRFRHRGVRMPFWAWMRSLCAVLWRAATGRTCRAERDLGAPAREPA